MAESHLFQRATPCDSESCENPAQYQCLNCEDALCNTCKEKHDKRKKNHKIVRYSERKKIECVKHNKHIIYWCIACEEMCCAFCAIKEHSGHDMDVIENAIYTAKNNLTKFLHGPFQEYLTKWENLMHEAEQLTTEYTASVQKIDQELILHAARIHEAVDKSLAKIRSELREISKIPETALQAQQKRMQDRYEQFKTDIEHLEELLQDDDLNILEYKLDIADIIDHPTLTRQSLPNYTPGQIDDQILMILIGNLNTTEQYVNQQKSTDTSNVQILQHSSQLPTTIATPVVVSSFYSGYLYPFIACTTSSGQAWVKVNNPYTMLRNVITWKLRGRRLQLMNRNGTVQKIIETDFFCNDFTVIPQGDILFTDNDNSRIAVKKASSKGIQTLFDTRCVPFGICCLRNGDIFVTFNSENGHQVIQYSSEGAIIHKFPANLFSNPERVAVNKVNEDMYVCDTGKKHLLVFSKDLKLQYEYIGSDDSSFDPRDVSTDNLGRIFVTDMINNRIHVLDKDGKFLQFIQPTGLNGPRHIDVDSEGYVWIGEMESRHVKIVKY